jgi:hypothetical protein
VNGLLSSGNPNPDTDSSILWCKLPQRIKIAAKSQPQDADHVPALENACFGNIQAECFLSFADIMEPGIYLFLPAGLISSRNFKVRWKLLLCFHLPLTAYLLSLCCKSNMYFLQSGSKSIPIKALIQIIPSHIGYFDYIIVKLFPDKLYAGMAHHVDLMREKT